MSERFYSILKTQSLILSTETAQTFQNLYRKFSSRLVQQHPPHFTRLGVTEDVRDISLLERLQALPEP